MKNARSLFCTLFSARCGCGEVWNLTGQLVGMHELEFSHDSTLEARQK